MYRTIAHTADIGFEVRAFDLDTLFAEAGEALFSIIVSNLSDVRRATQREFTIQGSNLEFLLLDWLHELLVTYESQRLLFNQFRVSIGSDKLCATALGESLDEARHRLDHEVKAITYHRLSVKQDGNEWKATVFVDI